MERLRAAVLEKRKVGVPRKRTSERGKKKSKRPVYVQKAERRGGIWLRNKERPWDVGRGREDRVGTGSNVCGNGGGRAKPVPREEGVRVEGCEIDKEETVRLGQKPFTTEEKGEAESGGERSCNVRSGGEGTPRSGTSPDLGKQKIRRQKRPRGTKQELHTPRSRKDSPRTCVEPWYTS